MAIEIIFPGILTTVQDYGRYGYQNFGISPNGVMDEIAYFDALELVSGNKTDAVLEATLFGPTIRFHHPTYFAITGADMSPLLDDIPVSMYQTIKAESGQILKLGTAKGCRSYIAFSGGISVPCVMGSRSTNLKCRFGGFSGRALAAGDLLPVDEVSVPIKKKECPIFSSSVTLRVIEGPQQDYFTENAFLTLYSELYTVTDLSDRMGCRLEGPALESKSGVDIISDGITFGSIQIPPNGKPIILLADRQTTGGYAKIGTIFSKDLQKLVQLQPGGKIRFERMMLDELS